MAEPTEAELSAVRRELASDELERQARDWLRLTLIDALDEDLSYGKADSDVLLRAAQIMETELEIEGSVEHVQRAMQLVEQIRKAMR